jgi:hypothetical protein
VSGQYLKESCESEIVLCDQVGNEKRAGTTGLGSKIQKTNALEQTSGCGCGCVCVGGWGGGVRWSMCEWGGCGGFGDSQTFTNIINERSLKL